MSAEHGNTHVLPDSRLRDRAREVVVVDWDMPDGTTFRCECVPVYCASCGHPYGHVPEANTTFCCYLCNQCFEDYGHIMGTYALPDAEFCKAVEYEMRAKHGRDLTDLELFALMEQGKLGSPLELLNKESPYALPSNRS